MSRAAIAWAGVILVAGVVAWWRFGARRRHMPCPAWFAWILENPYMNAVSGASLLLDRAEVAPGMRVLDAGSGPGRLAIPAAERVGASGEVVALDMQQAMLAMLTQRAEARRLTNIRALRGPIETSIPASDLGRFDRAFLVTVLGEIPDREAGLRSIHAALAPGGLLSVTEVLPDPHYQRRATVRRLAESTGFAVEQSFGTAIAFTMNLRKLRAPARRTP